MFGAREYYTRDTAGQFAFTERWMSMGTASNSPAIVKGMMERADELGWTTVRLNGSAEFKRQGWIAAEARGIKAIGYEPTQGDRQAAAEERTKLEALRSHATQARAQMSPEGNTITRESGCFAAARNSNCRPYRTTPGYRSKRGDIRGPNCGRA
jgi:hypothetical protein